MKTPPAGPPWDLPLAEAPLAFLDLEMTGLDPTKDRVLEVCIERVRGAVVDARLHTLVRPDQGETGNEHVHGIADVRDAPTFAELADQILELLDGAPIVAHGASWDVAFLEAEMARAGRPTTFPWAIDTLNLSRRTFALPRHSLDALAAHFGLDRTRAHRADADVAALREVFARCIGVLEPTTLRDLWEVRIAERRAREHIVAACRAALAEARPIDVVYRARARPPQTLRMVVVAVDDSHDPPRIEGYELPGRGRRSLRADRILKVDGALDRPGVPE